MHHPNIQNYIKIFFHFKGQQFFAISFLTNYLFLQMSSVIQLWEQNHKTLILNLIILSNASLWQSKKKNSQ
ncbi:hypothetical protein pb186bvf_000387 [Paramecium bursaria]